MKQRIHNTLIVVDRCLRLVGGKENPPHIDVVDRYLRRMGDKTIPDEAPPSLESFYPHISLNCIRVCEIALN